MTGLAFPKTESRKEAADERRARAAMHSEIRRQCLELDGGRCMNPECPSNRPYKDGTLPMVHPSQLDTAHIVGRGRGGAWTIGNVITLGRPCGCHPSATARKKANSGPSADEFMLKILDHYEGQPNDRWVESRDQLRITVARKRATGAIGSSRKGGSDED